MARTLSTSMFSVGNRTATRTATRADASPATVRDRASAVGPGPSRRSARTGRRRQHRSTLRQIDRRALERDGWRTTLEFRENHVRLDSGRLVEVEPFWLAEAERNGAVISAIARSESRVWSRLQARSRSADQDFQEDASA